ncbi:MAG: thrombospondin type 3 repeat-containing protein [Gammaproteobacteria bacterium]|nr:thrombospondin type 3 repeat-containing protein [Gammaproteobacteria bacterium]
MSNIDRPMNFTNYAEFNSVDFEAYITVESAVADLIWFGFGEGSPAAYNEPSNAVVFRIHSNNFQGYANQIDMTGVVPGPLTYWVDPVWGNENGNLWDADDEMTFGIKLEGTVITLMIVDTGATATFDLGDYPLNASNSMLFFGNTHVGTYFRDFSVETFPAVADDDEDGVDNVQDLCPNTPAGELVNADGCAESQLDDDGDGVSNAIDACPATPNGEDANADGCSLSQLDTDSDGVNDAIDACPATPAGAVVNAEGCTGLDVVETACDADGDWKNHGQFVSCVSNAVDAAVDGGLLTEEEGEAIVSAAAQSDVGKKNNGKGKNN